MLVASSTQMDVTLKRSVRTLAKAGIEPKVTTVSGPEIKPCIRSGYANKLCQAPTNNYNSIPWLTGIFRDWFDFTTRKSVPK